MDRHQKMKVLITGSSSVIGNSLAEQLLREGHDVVLFDIQEPSQETVRMKYIQGDIRGFDAVYEAAKGCDAGIHLAVLAGDSSTADILSVNTLGACAFFNAASKNKFRMSVLASSAPVHLPPNEHDTNLLLRTDSEDVYDLSKKIQETIAQDYHFHGLPTRCLRFGHVVRGKEKMTLNLKSPLHELDYCRGGWVALEDVVTGCVSALTTEADISFHPYNLVGSTSGRKRFEVRETEKRLGISLAYDFSEFE